MHVVQTITSMHDRFLFAPSSLRHTSDELHHWCHASSILNYKLSRPIRDSDRDSLWAAAAILGGIAFSSVEASTPEEIWPLKSESSELVWLNMSVGKMIIWEIADPSRPESVFNPFAQEMLVSAHDYAAEDGIDGMLVALVQLCDLDKSSTASNSPYHSPVKLVTFLLAAQYNDQTFFKGLSFVTHMHPEFRNFIQQKEPRALLLLAFWFSQIFHFRWWLTRRSIVQGQAICIYLERYHADNASIMKLLQIPKSRLGMLDLSSSKLDEWTGLEMKPSAASISPLEIRQPRFALDAT
jgi:hypothetical protein